MWHEALHDEETYCSACATRGPIPAKTARSGRNPRKRRKKAPVIRGAVSGKLPPAVRKALKEQGKL